MLGMRCRSPPPAVHRELAEAKISVKGEVTQKIYCSYLELSRYTVQIKEVDEHGKSEFTEHKGPAQPSERSLAGRQRRRSAICSEAKDS